MTKSTKLPPMRHLLPLLLFVTAASSTTCYLPNGQPVTAASHKPCSNDKADPMHTICCADGDSVGKEGICEHRNDREEVSWYRGSCTEAEWGSGKCALVCNEPYAYELEQIAVHLCTDSPGKREWCCGSDSSCCDGGAQIIKLRALTSATTSSPATTATTLGIKTSSIISSSTSSPKTTNSQTQTSGDALHFELGLGLGLGAFFAIAIAIAVLVYIRQSRAQKRHLAKKHSREKGKGKVSELVLLGHENENEHVRDEERGADELPEWTSHWQGGRHG
ncbi:hypothetical protein P154DRAFT_524191 [Amniculicola lignicola CBS 123094]|uniref:Mid2 domain-containing protein n=1 Tax=Amniculicola lignicola CBS 123094 TaxID=1392246 RepID=A0A6A5WGG6_9PLEO|nr:hypothetical protein P154DRAFT_524191 [Amniculicola lignicola CBS 123094]